MGGQTRGLSLQAGIPPELAPMSIIHKHLFRRRKRCFVFLKLHNSNAAPAELHVFVVEGTNVGEG